MRILVQIRGDFCTPAKMQALFAKSQFVEIERLTTLGSRFFDERLKFWPRTRIIDNLLPMLVAFCEFTQLVEHSASLSFAQLW